MLETCIPGKWPMRKTDCAIEIANLGVNYDGCRVLEGFDLKLAVDEKVVLTGTSGSGKSTVLKCILGLVEPWRGSIHVFGLPVDGHGVWTVRRSLAYVAQEPEFGAGTALQAIARPFAYKVNASLRVSLDRLPGLMERFNLPQVLLDKEIATLSGGEKQRIALVSAILLNRPILLLDEASSALDKANKEAVAEFLKQADGLTVLSVAHDTEWFGCADRVVNLSGACVQREGNNE